MTDYIIIKGYDNSLPEVTLDQVIDLKNSEQIDLLEVEFLTVIQLGKKEVTRKTITIPKEKFINNGGINLTEEKIVVNGYASIVFEITALDERARNDVVLQSKFVSITLGSPLAKMQSTLATKEHEIAALKEKVVKLERKNYEYNQDVIIDLELQKAHEIENLEAQFMKKMAELARLAEEIKLVEEIKTDVSKPEGQNSQQIVSKTREQVKDPLKQAWLEEYELTRSYFMVQAFERMNGDTTVNKLYAYLLSSNDNWKNHSVYKYFLEYIGKSNESYPIIFNSEEDSTYVSVNSPVEAYVTSLYNIENDFLEYYGFYKIDPQATIAAKYPLNEENKRIIPLSHAGHIKDFFQFPPNTRKILCVDHTYNDLSQDQAGTAYLSYMGGKALNPGKPNTINMWTIAARLTNGNITRPVTFITKTPPLAISGGK